MRLLTMRHSLPQVLLLLYINLDGRIRININKYLESLLQSSLCWSGSSDGISNVRISGPRVLENGRQQYVDLTCSFRFQAAEYKQLDIKWYFDNEVGLTTDY